jgi:hypothetical protein
MSEASQFGVESMFMEEFGTLNQVRNKILETVQANAGDGTLSNIGRQALDQFDAGVLFMQSMEGYLRFRETQVEGKAKEAISKMGVVDGGKKA